MEKEDIAAIRMGIKTLSELEWAIADYEMGEFSIKTEGTKVTAIFKKPVWWRLRKKYIFNKKLKACKQYVKAFAPIGFNIEYKTE